MNQLLAVIKREISIKIKTKEFYLIVLVSPLLFLVPIIAGMFFNSQGGTLQESHVGIYSEDEELLKDTVLYRGIKFFPIKSKELYPSQQLVGILEISKNQFENSNSNSPIKLYIKKENLVKYGQKLKDIETYINEQKAYKEYTSLNFSDSIAPRFSKFKNVYPIIVNNEETKAKSLAQGIAFIVGMLIYITLILFNNSILKGVIEEKTNRLVEVLSIFVKSINLMLGKILGLGFLSLLQLVLWLVVFYFYIKIIGWYEINFLAFDTSSTYIFSLLQNLKSLPLEHIFIFLPIFFILGFLFNGAITTITAIYSSSYNVNYLSFLSNMLNIVSIYFAMFVAVSPESSIARISVYIPFLSYLTVPTFLPYGISLNTILISMSILVITTSLLIYYSSILYKKSILPEVKKKKQRVLKTNPIK